MKLNVKSLLELARRRSSRMRRSKTLNNLAASSIITKFGKHVKDGGHNLAILPASLRESLLLELVKRRSNQKKGEEQKTNVALRKAVNLLISSETKKFEFGGLLSFSQRGNVLRNTFKILQILARAPNLQHLILDIKKRFSRDDPLLLENRSIQAISRMENLTIIKNINFAIKYVHLKSICKVLKNLQFAEFRNIDFSDMRLRDLGADIEDFKLSFSRLTVFLFQSTRGMVCPFENKLTSLCMQHLPNLEIIGRFLDKDEGMSPLEESLIPAEPCALRHLRIIPSTSDLPAAFPKVTNLQVHCRVDEMKDKYKSILHFSSIECLILDDLQSIPMLDRYIVAYGANLHTLIIGGHLEPEKTMDGQSSSFSTIFACCPKLQRLDICNIDISDDKEPINHFAPLREFKWTPYYGQLQKFEVANILSALPNLEKFSLSSWENLDVDDLQILTSKIAENEILGKLTEMELRFSVDPAEMEEDYLQLLDVGLLRAVRDLIANAAAFLPNLIDIDFHLVYIQGELIKDLKSSKLDQIHKIGEKFQELIGDDSIAEFIRAIQDRN